MTPGARVQAAIELLDSILVSWIPSPRRGEAGRGASTEQSQTSYRESPHPNPPPAGEGTKRFPADKQIDGYFKSRRYIGSKDRAYIGELVYWVLRHKAALEWYIAPPPIGGRLGGGRKPGDISQTMPPPQPSPYGGGRKLILAALILRGEYNPHSIHMLAKEGKYSPTPLSEEEKKLCLALEEKEIEHSDMPLHVRLNFPQWMETELKESLGEDFESEMRALNEQAPMDLRVNTLKTTREALEKNLKAEGFDVSPAPVSPVGLRLAKRAPIFTSQYFKLGHFEVQDEASQLVSLIVDVAPGMKVIDFCAGAGGKTLAMAAAMKNKGRILAWDNSEKRLNQLSPRLKRAGVDNVQAHVIGNESDQFIKRHKASADRVLVDAPCSGTGTWRRNPDLKWRFTQKDLDEMILLQQSILQSAARLVKPGGRLVYATCSLLQAENERQIQWLLEKNSEFGVVSAEKIWDKARYYFKTAPHRDGMDGFFAAVLERNGTRPLA